MASKFLLLFKPLVPLTFEIKKPEKEIRFGEKVGWTLAAVIIYLVMLATPVYGYVDEGGADPFLAIRTILASSRGSLAELGIGPIVTAGLIMQLLVGSQIISVNFNDPDERALYTGAQKVMSVGLTLFEAIAYMVGGAYGDSLTFQSQVLIVIQLLFAGIIIMMMDEMIQKGWGLGSGISIFIATAVSLQIIQGLFDLQTIRFVAGGDTWFRGAILSAFQSLGRPDNFLDGIVKPGRIPDMVAVAATLIVFAVVIFAESMKLEIPVQHVKMRVPARYPIKLLYVSNIPVILVSALFANIYFVSNLTDNRWGQSEGFRSIVVSILGRWDNGPSTMVDEAGNAIPGDPIPVSGIAAYTTPPFGIEAVIQNWDNAIIYFIIMVVLCTAFSMVWIETAGLSSRDVAKQILNADMQIPGFRRDQKIIRNYLQNYIPYVAFVGGVFIGILAACADFIGALGTGVGILLTTGIIKQYYEILAKERLAEIAPGLAGLIGIL